MTNEREKILNDAMMAPDAVEVCPGVRVRRMSMQSLAMCSRVGVKIPGPDDLKSAETPEDAFRVFPAISEFVFIHAAPIEAVEECVYVKPSLLARNADRFLTKIPVDKLVDVFLAISADQAAISAAETKIDSEAPDSKNTPSPAGM